MANTYKFDCLHCKSVISISDDQLGQKMDCTSCTYLVRAPSFLLSEEDKISKKEADTAIVNKLASSDDRDFKCIHCFNIVDFDSSMCGEKVSCPHCDKMIKLPLHIYEKEPIKTVARKSVQNSQNSTEELTHGESSSEDLPKGQKDFEVRVDDDLSAPDDLSELDGIKKNEYDAVYSTREFGQGDGVPELVDEDQEARRLGGWLVLLAIGMVVTPIRMIAVFSQTFTPLFQDGLWAQLTSPSSSNYVPGLSGILIFEIIGNICLLVAWIYMAIRFFGKKINSPKFYTVLSICSVVFIIIDAVAVTAVMPHIPLMDAETGKELFRGLFACCVWAPYLIKSKRSRETFVN